MKTKAEVVVRRLPGRKADLGELCPKVPSAPSWHLPGWAERKQAGRPPLGISTGCRGGVGEGSSQRTVVGACPALHTFPLLVPPGNNTWIFLWGTPSSPLSLNVCRHVYVISWRRQWHPTPVLLPAKSHRWRSLVGCSPWGR